MSAFAPFPPMTAVPADEPASTGGKCSKEDNDQYCGHPFAPRHGALEVRRSAARAVLVLRSCCFIQFAFQRTRMVVGENLPGLCQAMLRHLYARATKRQGHWPICDRVIGECDRGRYAVCFQPCPHHVGFPRIEEFGYGDEHGFGEDHSPECERPNLAARAARLLE